MYAAIRQCARPAGMAGWLLMTAGGMGAEAPTAGPDTSTRLPIPARVEIAAGCELNLWDDTLWPVAGPPARVDIRCEVGRRTGRGFHFAPGLDQAGRVYPAVAEVRSPDGAVLSSQPFEIRVAPHDPVPAPLQVLFLGDSLTAAGVISAEVKRRIEEAGGPAPVLLGSAGASDDNRHEGHGGWSFRTFVGPLTTFYRFRVSGVANPPPIAAGYEAGGRMFRVRERLLEPDGAGAWRGSLVCQVRAKDNPGIGPTNMPAPPASGILRRRDMAGNADAEIRYDLVEFPVPGNPLWDPGLNGGRGGLHLRRYMHTRRCWGAADRMDVAFVMLGVNDCSGVALQPESARAQTLDLLLAQCRTLVAAILDPECGYPGCRVVLALTPIGCNTPEAYAGGLEFMTRYEAAVRGLWERLLREFDGNPAHPRVRVAIAGLMADRDLGYSKAERQVDGETRLVHNNAVHPNEIGYRQAAAACYSTLRGWLADAPIGAAPREAVSRRIQSPDVHPTRNQEAH